MPRIRKRFAAALAAGTMIATGSPGVASAARHPGEVESGATVTPAGWPSSESVQDGTLDAMSAARQPSVEQALAAVELSRQAVLAARDRVREAAEALWAAQKEGRQDDAALHAALENARQAAELARAALRGADGELKRARAAEKRLRAKATGSGSLPPLPSA